MLNSYKVSMRAVSQKGKIVSKDFLSLCQAR
jgi:hypothetical protein